MTILHICNSYGYNYLYSNLTLKLSNHKIRQLVFVPIRKHIKLNNIETNNSYIKIFFSDPINFLDRIIFNKKKQKLYKNILERVPLKNISMIHAHTLFSDGSLAQKLKKEKNIRYIVAIRNTDINIFFKYFIFYRKMGLEILLDADKIIFISPSYVEKLISRYVPKSKQNELLSKIEIIPNGVDDYWLKNKITINKQRNIESKLLFVGDFSPNKNLITVIKAVEQLYTENLKISLNIIGGGGTNSNKVINYINKCDKKIINYIGKILDKKILLEYYRNSDLFVMASFYETFGLVYIEAMTQGLPILYSKGEGVDGFFSEYPPGYPVNPRDIEDIKNKIRKALENIDLLSKNCLEHVENFSWDKISNEYYKLYTT